MVLILFSAYAQATIEQHSNNALSLGLKTYIYDINILNTPHTKDGPPEELNFTVGDDIRVSNQYFLGDGINNGIVSDDLGANGVLDWRYIFTLDGTPTTINGYYDNYKQGNISFDWFTIHTAQINNYSAVTFSSGNNTNLFQPGHWRVVTLVEGISFSEAEFNVFAAPVAPALAVPQLQSFNLTTNINQPIAIQAQSNSVPEPGSVLLLGLGFILLGRKLYK